jgi:acyl carrier protein
MKKLDINHLKTELKDLIVSVCNLGELGITPADIGEDQDLIDPDSPLGLDSLDAVEIVVALEKTYNVRIRDVDTSKKVLKSLNVLAGYLADHLQTD